MATIDVFPLLEKLLPIATDLAVKLVKDVINHAASEDEALAQLRVVDEQLPQALADLRARLAANDAAEDARRRDSAPVVEVTTAGLPPPVEPSEG